MINPEKYVLKRQTYNDYFMPFRVRDAVYAYRFRVFIKWLDTNGRSWLKPNLGAYTDYLLNEYTGRDDKPLSPSTVKAHLSTIRGRYKAILRDNATRDLLYEFTSPKDSPSNRKALIDEVLERLKNAIEPENSKIQVVVSQDRPDDDHIRLTQEQASKLLSLPGTDSLIGLRDTCVIGLMLCTGIREGELCALDVVDLRRKLGGEIALHVRRGKGAKERLIPYGSLIWILDIVEQWLSNAGINNGAVLRGFYKGAKRIRPTRLTVRAINQILERYPVVIDGELRKINPHNLRRTYARRLYDSGMELLAIRDNLGHADSRTTLKYIGQMDVEARKPDAIYDFDSQFLKDTLP